MVLCSKNCSDLLLENIILMIKKHFLRSNSNLLEQWKVRIIFETKCFFNLLLEVPSRSNALERLNLPIGTNNSDVETYRNKLEKSMVLQFNSCTIPALKCQLKKPFNHYLLQFFLENKSVTKSRVHCTLRKQF